MGFPHIMIFAPGVDSAPLAVSKMTLGTPDASSTTNSMWGEWKPASDSGFSRRDVLATAKLSGAPFRLILSALNSSSSLNAGGMLRAQRSISVHNTSDSWCALFAVTATLHG